MGHFSPLKKIKNNPRPGQNLVLKIDWTGAYFGPGQIVVQNNPRPGQDRGYMGHFLPLKDIKIIQVLSQRNKKPRPGQNLNKKPTPGQNLVLKIEWAGT